MSKPGRIRNFCIVAHIDHGKSTLADRMLELTGTLTKRNMQDQVLDSMDLERERGITIKSHPIRMQYHDRKGKDWIFNLIDTPGHVDFSYEVSRSLAACEGAILVVDAAQGIEAQTLANLYLALEGDLEILPVVNKIDLPSARSGEVVKDLMNLLGVEAEDVLLASAKSGLGVDAILEAVARRLPGPEIKSDEPLRALIFDSSYDLYLGAVATVRVVEGHLRKGDKIRFLATSKIYEVQEVGHYVMGRKPTNILGSGEVGYLVTGAKQVRDFQVGDTIVRADTELPRALPGYKPVKPMVFSGLYPTENEEYEVLREALSKLQLNDSAITFEPETSRALGFGFRVGFLGMLHMEIVQERLEREFGLSMIATLPNVGYQVLMKDGSERSISNPADMPETGDYQEIREPHVRATLYSPAEYVGSIMKLCMDRRAVQEGMNYLDGRRVELHYRIPLSEIVVDFYDKLKSLTRGHASFDYEYGGHEPSDLVKLDILINGDPVDALSAIVHRSNAHDWGDKLARKLKEQIPRQLFQVAIQASIGARVVARTNVSALRKNVTAKCYGGDITRKRKLLEKQKAGKRRMKQVGNVEIPQEAFLAILKVER